MPSVNRCCRIIEAFDKAKDKYNEQYEWKDKRYDKHCFGHEHNGTKSAIEDNFAVMEAFAKQPIGAYMKGNCEEFYFSRQRRIRDELVKMQGNAFRCLDYWKHKSKFWDPSFDW